MTNPESPAPAGGERTTPPVARPASLLAHALLVFFYRPIYWPVWLVALGLLGLAGLIGLWWAALSGNARVGAAAAELLLIGFAADVVVLRAQQAQRITAVSWKGQTFSLAVARDGVAAVLGVFSLWWGWPPGLWLLLAAQVLGSGLLIYGALVEPRRLSVSELSFSSNRLPPGSAPLRLLHVSDIHIERSAEREAQVLRLAATVAPDLILLSGDYVNTSFNTNPDTLRDVHAFLRGLSAAHGVFAVLGSPTVDLHRVVPALFEGSDVTLLRNDARRVALGDGRVVHILGVECRHDIDHDAARLAALHPEAHTDGPSVLLYHSPELLHQAVSHGLDLYVCGHTHGGQVRLPVIGALVTFSQLGRRYAMGHYHEGRTHLYVSRGVGFEGLSAPRLRFLCPPEITLITIRPE